MRLHYQAPTLEELDWFKPILPDRLLTYTRDVWPGYPAPVFINGSNGSSSGWEVGVFGLAPPWSDPYLTRNVTTVAVDKVHTMPVFRNAWFQRQLCVIPVSGFVVQNYESGRPVPWRIERNDHCPFYVAGLWMLHSHDQRNTCWSFAMLTCNAEDHPLMNRFFHKAEEKHSLLILPNYLCAHWLDMREESEILGCMQLPNPDVFSAYENEIF